jgi:glycosyltransferase involved in cell wall biosynthesis
MIVENLPVPFDRRVWMEALALRENGYEVNVICPRGHGYAKPYEIIEGIYVHRHPLPYEADSAIGYAFEYVTALFWELVLAIRISVTRGFDVIHACNPPDTIFLIGRLFRIFGKRFVFDHHDINPELYEAKFQRRDIFYSILCWLERQTFATATVSIATNESYRRIAIERGGMSPGRVFVVRSAPDIKRIRHFPPDPSWRRGRRFLVAYVGVMGSQEGLDLLLQGIAHLKFQMRRDDTHFKLMGGGTELPALQALADTLQIADIVEFTGRVPDDTLWAVLGTADVCVNPDRVNEMNDKSTMNKIIEYMAFGKPIVQFDLTEGRYSAGDASLYARANDPIDFAEKIASLLDDESARIRMGLAGRQRIEAELAWHHQVPKLLAAYEVATS